MILNTLSSFLFEFAFFFFPLPFTRPVDGRFVPFSFELVCDLHDACRMQASTSSPPFFFFFPDLAFFPHQAGGGRGVVGQDRVVMLFPPSFYPRSKRQPSGCYDFFLLCRVFFFLYLRHMTTESERNGRRCPVFPSLHLSPCWGDEGRAGETGLFFLSRFSPFQPAGRRRFGRDGVFFFF